MPTAASDQIAVSTAASILGVHADTVREWTAAGRLEARRTLGGHRRYSRSQIEQLSLRLKGHAPARRESFDAGLGSLQGRSGLFQPGQLIVLAGIAASGKSTTLMHIIDHALAANRDVTLFQLELGRQTLLLNMAQRAEGVGRGEAGRILDTPGPRHDELMKLILPPSLRVIDSQFTGAGIYSPLTPDRIEHVVRALAQSDPPAASDVIVIDCLEMVAVSDGDPAYAPLGGRAHIARHLKALAEATGALVIVTSMAPRTLQAGQTVSLETMAWARLCDGLISVSSTSPDLIRLQAVHVPKDAKPGAMIELVVDSVTRRTAVKGAA